MKELYLAGKIAELLAAFEGMKGVEEVVAGRAKASGELEVKCVRVQYNPKKTDICELLKKYFNEGVNPYIIAEDPLEQAAVIYNDRNNRQIQSGNGVILVASHLDTAITSHMHYSALAATGTISHLGTHSSRQAKAHSTKSPRGKPCSRLSHL